MRTTPFWVGIHEGDFDSYDGGSPSSPQLERLAEDGNIDPISALFNGEGQGRVDGVVGTGEDGDEPLEPRDSGSLTLTVDDLEANPFFSYVAMVLPSNDAFVANGNPQIFDLRDGTLSFTIGGGSDVNDAGTEDNDEFPANTAGLGQTVPNTGTPSNTVIVAHPGYIPDGPILTRFPGADFTQDGYQIARVMVTAREDTDTTDNLVPVTVTVENLAPANGVRLSPFWVGFHDGSFDSYDGGTPSSPELERLAEDGDSSALSTLMNYVVPLR